MKKIDVYMTYTLTIHEILLYISETEARVLVKFSKESIFHLMLILPTYVCANLNLYATSHSSPTKLDSTLFH